MSLGPVHPSLIQLTYICVLEIKHPQSYKTYFISEFMASVVTICVLNKTWTAHILLCFMRHVSFVLNHKCYLLRTIKKARTCFLGRYFGQKSSRCCLKDCLELCVTDTWTDPFQRNLNIFVGVIFAKSRHGGVINW